MRVHLIYVFYALFPRTCHLLLASTCGGDNIGNSSVQRGGKKRITSTDEAEAAGDRGSALWSCINIGG